MDFLRRIGRFIGGAAQGVGRAFQQAPQVISRGVLDAERARQQAIAQVQRNLPRFQAPPPPRIQLPQIQIPRVQAPRVDLGAVSRALGNYYNRTALSQVVPGIQRELPKIDRNIQSFNERLLGGLGRTAIRTGEFVLPGKTENISEAMIQRLFPEAGTAAGRRGLTPLADPRSFGGRLGTGAKAAVDVAGIVLPSTAVTNVLKGTQIAQKGLQGGRLARLGTLAATEAIGGIPASAASIAQARGQQKPVDLKREVGTGLLIDAGTPLGIKLLGKGYRAIRGAISNAPTAAIEEAAKGIKGIKPQQAIQQAVIAGVPIAKTTRPVATISKAAQAQPNYVTVYRAGQKGRVGDNYFTSNPAFAQNVKKDLIAEGTKPQIISRRINTNDYLDIRNPAQKAQLEDLLGPQKVQELLDAGSNGLPAVVVGKGQLKGYVGDEIMLRSAANRLGFKGIQISEGKDMISKYPNLEGVTFAKAIPQAKIKVAKEVTGITPTMTKPIYETVPESAMKPKAPKGVEPTPRAMQPVPQGQETARFATQLENDVQVPNEVLQNIFPGYTRLPNETVYKNAVDMLNKNQSQFIEDMISRKLPVTAENNAAAMVALRNLIDEGSKGSLKKATRLAQATIAQGTDAGRAVQIFSKWRSTTPEGATIQATKVINEYNEKVAGKLIGKKQFLELTPEKQTKITELANDVQKYADGTRERQVSEALLGKYIAELVPLTKGQKLASIQYIAQLLNVKTALRNIIGNTTAAGANDVANVLASGIDGALFKLGVVKQRSVVVPNILKGVKGAAKGAKYAVEDVQLGIKTSGATGSYEIKPQVFKNGILRKLENALGYELSVPDKAFYQRAFDISLDNQMRAAAKSGKAVDKPTAQMIAQANEEGLYQTFQNNSVLARSLVQVKRFLNKVGTEDFGAGNIIINYPKTPGNIISQGVDFTPVGIARGTYNLAKAIRNELPVTAQRNAILNIGRGLTGTGLISLGYVLAATGIMTASRDTNKKQAGFERVTGAGPFTINLTALERFTKGGDPSKQKGDLVVNYDWLQPNAIQLSMGANLKLAPKQNDKVGTFLDNLISSTNASINTVLEQPVLSGVGRLTARMFGGGVTKADVVGAITDTAAAVPASFIPSTINQIGQSLDKFARETRSANAVTEAYNKTIARIPGLRQTLPMKYDVLGKPINTFDPEAGGNNFFNVFLNPTFPRKVKEDAAIRLIDDLYEKTGSKDQFPKVTGDAVEISRNGKAERIKLNTDQISQYQQYVGSRTEAAYQQLAQDSRFTSLSPEDQVKKIANIITDINTAARMELFGHSPSQVDKASINIIQGGNPVDYELTPKTKPKKPKLPKVRKGRTGRGRRGGRGRVAKVKVPKLKTPRITVKGLPRVPTARAKKVSFKVPKPKASPRKSIKIRQG